jgi:hypothetical protein
MIEFLVEEMDFTVFAIEATFAGALELNDYVLTGDGDPQRALASLIYPAWNTEEVLALVNWMREYNATHEKKVKFYGFDNKPATGSAKTVYRYLRKTNGTNDYDQVLSSTMNHWTAGQLTSAPGSGCMGDHLRQIYGDDMIIFDLLCNRTSPGASDGSVEGVLAEAGLKMAILRSPRVAQRNHLQVFQRPAQDRKRRNQYSSYGV